MSEAKITRLPMGASRADSYVITPSRITPRRRVEPKKTGERFLAVRDPAPRARFVNTGKVTEPWGGKK